MRTIFSTIIDYIKTNPKKTAGIIISIIITHYSQNMSDNMIQSTVPFIHLGSIQSNILTKDKIECNPKYGKKVILNMKNHSIDTYKDEKNSTWVFQKINFKNIENSKTISAERCCTETQIALNQCWFKDNDLKEYSILEELGFKALLYRVTGHTKIFREPE